MSICPFIPHIADMILCESCLIALLTEYTTRGNRQQGNAMKEQRIQYRICDKLLVIVIVLFSCNARGQTAPIFDLSVPSHISGGEQHGNGMVGWGFSLSRSVTVTQVGWYDDNQDGLSRDWQVGLWNGTSLTQNVAQLLGDPQNGIIIPGGANTKLEGVWRVVDLPTPLVLPSGSYSLGGLDTAATADPIAFMRTLEFPTDLISFPSPFYAALPNQPIFGPPKIFIALDGVEFGPMLFISVPEPPALILAATGLICLVALHRRRRIWWHRILAATTAR